MAILSPSFYGLYVITDERLTPYKEGKIFELVEKALKGGARIVQLRDKTHKDKDLVDIALKLKKLCHNYQALFIVNDRIKLAQLVSADGVHLGKEDFSLEEAKEILKDKIIGISCYGDLERAKRAQEKGASYVAFGSVYPSPTKPTSEVISKKVLREAKRTLKIPICAIGGITLEKTKELLELGVDLIAVISDIWKSEDIEKRAQSYYELFKKYRIKG